MYFIVKKLYQYDRCDQSQMIFYLLEEEEEKKKTTSTYYFVRCLKFFILC